MIITLDWDHTLTQPIFQELAKWITSETNHEVFILTSRSNSLIQKQYKEQLDNAEIFKIAKSAGIEPQNVIFTNQESKRYIIIRSKVAIHFEDSDTEIQNIKQFCKVFDSKDKASVESAKEYIKQF